MPRTTLARPTPRTLTLGLALASSACVTVTPAQRQTLSTPEMTPVTEAEEEVWHTHFEAAREAGFGGHGGAGGGCGCG
ncbi:MAG: DUF4266 domain-containing protein [Myxococcota bacterium]